MQTAESDIHTILFLCWYARRQRVIYLITPVSVCLSAR